MRKSRRRSRQNVGGRGVEIWRGVHVREQVEQAEVEVQRRHRRGWGQQVVEWTPDTHTEAASTCANLDAVLDKMLAVAALRFGAASMCASRSSRPKLRCSDDTDAVGVSRLSNGHLTHTQKRRAHAQISTPFSTKCWRSRR